MDFGGILFSRASEQKEQYSAITKVQDSYYVHTGPALKAVQEIFYMGSWQARDSLVCQCIKELHHGLNRCRLCSVAGFASLQASAN